MIDLILKLPKLLEWALQVLAIGFAIPMAIMAIKDDISDRRENKW